MTIKTVLKYMAVVGAVAIAAPSAYAQQAYINIGADDNGPIIPVYGNAAMPSSVGSAGYVDTAEPVYTGTVIETPVAAPVTGDYGEQAYINIGTDDGGPIIPADGNAAVPTYPESTGYVDSAEPVYTGTMIEAPVAAPVMGYYPVDPYTNIGTDRGGPIFDLHSGMAAQRMGATPYYGEPVVSTEPVLYDEPAAYSGPNVETPAYYVPVRGDSGSPLIPVYR